MPSQSNYIPIQGSLSRRGEDLVVSFDSTGREQTPDLDSVAEVTVVVRSRQLEEMAGVILPKMQYLFPQDRLSSGSWTEQEIWERCRARQEDLDAVKSFAESKGLDVIGESSPRRCVTLRGSLGTLSKAFCVGLSSTEHPEHPGRGFHTPSGLIQIPRNLAPVVSAVIGLDNVPVLQRSAIGGPIDEEDLLSFGLERVTPHYEPSEIAEMYDFPGNRGKGECIGIIALGGGFHEADLDRYFTHQGLRKPDIQVVEVGGQKNQPADAAAVNELLNRFGIETEPISFSSPTPDREERNCMANVLWTIETTMDVELAGAFANEARIVVYFAPNSEQGKYQAFTTALNDTANRPSVISCSWGNFEQNFSEAYMLSMDQCFQEAALKNITVCVASGDYGSGMATTGELDVYFPASSAHVLACGGTQLTRENRSEVVWSETLAGASDTSRVSSGGGTSRTFSLPSWQSVIGIERLTGHPGRAVPDVAAKADVMHGYCIIVGGSLTSMGGTSSAAPLWAALVALFNEQLGHRCGYLTPLLYRDEFRGAFNDVTEGHNDLTSGKPRYYHACPGWDACTGLGTPRGRKILSALAAGATPAD